MKTIIVTGATDGIGRETVRQLLDVLVNNAGVYEKRRRLTADGARTSVYLATSEDVAGVSGAYFIDCREKTPSRRARDDRLADSLWVESERLLARFL